MKNQALPTDLNLAFPPTFPEVDQFELDVFAIRSKSSRSPSPCSFALVVISANNEIGRLDVAVQITYKDAHKRSVTTAGWHAHGKTRTSVAHSCTPVRQSSTKAFASSRQMWFFIASSML